MVFLVYSHVGLNVVSGTWNIEEMKRGVKYYKSIINRTLCRVTYESVFDPGCPGRVGAISKRKIYKKNMLNFGYVEFEWLV